MTRDSVGTRESGRVGTAKNPIFHPVTGERIIFRRRSRDTQGDMLELLMAPGGFIAAEHVHPNQEERFQIEAADRPGADRSAPRLPSAVRTL